MIITDLFKDPWNIIDIFQGHETNYTILFALLEVLSKLVGCLLIISKYNVFRRLKRVDN